MRAGQNLALDRQPEVDAPDRLWAPGLTDIKTHEASSYRAVAIDLFSRPVVGEVTQPRMTTVRALHALLSALWRRKPKTKMMIHAG